jgi:putative acetyltransferase
VIIRPARTEDAATIRSILVAAFGRPTEANLVQRLLDDNELVLALLAERDDTACGCVAFARLAVESPNGHRDAVGLAPLAVMPGERRQGLGAALTRKGLLLLAEQGETLVFVVGDPAYYTRFGFDPAAARSFASPYAGSHFMALRLTDHAPASGVVHYPGAFAGLH